MALVHHAGTREPAVGELATALRARGHHVTVVGDRLARAPEAPLRLRKIDERLSHVPAAVLALRAGRYDVVHALSAPDALAAAYGARGPWVVTFTAPVRREDIANRRGRIALHRRATEDAAAVLAATPAVAESLRRWLAVEATVMAPADGEAHEALYRALPH